MNLFSKTKKNKLYMHQDSNKLKSELLNLLVKKFNLYTQLRVGQLKKTDVLRKTRRELARIKFYLSK